MNTSAVRMTGYPQTIDSGCNVTDEACVMTIPATPSVASPVVADHESFETVWSALSQLLIAAIRPARVYKVEHQVLGRDHRKGYCCLIVLLPVNHAKPLKEYDSILELTNAGAAPVECSFHRIRTITTWLSEGHPFFCRALIPGNLIYNDGSVTLPEPAPAVMEEMNKRIAGQFRIFFDKAEAFYRCASLMLNKCQAQQPALTTFMLHQAVELGYRSILESLNGYCKKTHDLQQLRKQTLRCAPALSDVFPDDTPVERELVDLLKSAYSGARYDHQFTISSQEQGTLFARVRAFLMFAKSIGPPMPV